MLKQDYDTYKHDKSTKIKWVDINSHDPLLKEMAAMMPESMKKDIKEVFGYQHGFKFPIREEMYNYMLGFRAYSASNALQNINTKGFEKANFKGSRY